MLKLDDIFVRLDLHLLDSMLGAKISHSWNIDERDGVEAFYPLKLDAHALAKTLLGLEISQHGEIVGRIRGHTGDDGSTLGHADSWKRKDVDEFIGGHWSLDLLADEL